MGSYEREEKDLEERSSNISNTISASSELTIMPNPASSFVTINSNKDIIAMNIFSTDGKLIASPENFETIEISNMPTGILIFNIQLEDGSVETKKVIKL